MAKLEEDKKIEKETKKKVKEKNVSKTEKKLKELNEETEKASKPVRTVETRQQKKKKGILKGIIITLIILILLAGGGFLVWKFVLDKEEKPTAPVVVELENVKDFGYVLTERDSEYYKKCFEDMKNIINEDEIVLEDYTSQVAKMFIIDLYTLSTKVNKYDIGGIEFFHVKKKTMFEQKVMDTLYSIMLDDTYKDRVQELPEVSNVEIVSNTKTSYKLGKTAVEAYLVKLKITYVKDLGYDSEASVVVVKENGERWSVVDHQPTLKPKYS